MPPRKQKRAAPVKEEEPSDDKDQVDPEKLKMPELKAELKKRGLDTSGKKADLVERLKEALEEGEPSSKKKKEEEMTDVGRFVSALKAEAKKDEKKAKNRKVDSHVPFNSIYSVVGDFDCMLNQTNIGANNNKFYVIQILFHGGQYLVWTRWGRVGESGQNSLKSFVLQSDAEKEFKKKFTDKTRNKWDDREKFTPVPGKYTLIEMADDDDDDVVDTAPVKMDTGPPKKVKPCSLDAPTQKLLKLIFDTDMFNDALLSYNIDTKKMPLGKLSKAQIAKGFEILEDIEKALERKASHFELNSLSSKFYTAIPHDFGRQIPPAIKTAEGLQKKYDMLMVLGDIELAQTLQKDQEKAVKNVEEVPHPLDVNYSLLKTKLEYVRTSDQEHKLLEEYIENTGGAFPKQNLMGIWRVDREGEGQRFAEHSKLDNRKLLWHGTNVAVVAAIMKTGLRIMPHSGGRVGRGIYFASEHSKSAGYVWPAKNTGIMFLNEVALGKEKHITRDDSSLVKAPSGFDSVVARGHREPDPSSDDFLEFDGRKVTVPKGKPVPMTPYKGSSFFQSEYLVYKESQVRIRYLLTFKR